MKNDEISRVKDDLETVREAVGLGLPFGREDITLSLVMATAAAFLFVWSLFWAGYWLVVGAIPLFAIILAGAIWLGVKYRRRSGRSSLRRKEYAFSNMGGLLFFAAVVAFIVWSGKINIPRPYAYTTVCFFIGVMFLSFGIFHAPRRRYLAGAVALFVMAVGIPWSYDQYPVALVSASVVGWGLADAGIMALQLRKTRATL